MSKTTERSVTPHEIMAFLYDVSGEKTKIEPAGNGHGFQICTYIGSSFEFEIVADSEGEVARKYFNHCCDVYGYIVERSKSFAWRFFHKFSKKEREDCVRKLACLHAWRNTYL